LIRNSRRAIALLTMVASLSTTAVAIPDPAYITTCQMCHQRGGEGLPGEFPRLNGRLDQIAVSPLGRRYLVLVVLYGMAGAITVDGKKIVGFMPSMGSLKDVQIASILNGFAVAAGKKVAPFTPGEVAGIRGQGPMTSSQTATERGRLVAAGLIP